jgi:hypothetical protein
VHRSSFRPLLLTSPSRRLGNRPESFAASGHSTDFYGKLLPSLRESRQLLSLYAPGSIPCGSYHGTEGTTMILVIRLLSHKTCILIGSWRPGRRGGPLRPGQKRAISTIGRRGSSNAVWLWVWGMGDAVLLTESEWWPIMGSVSLIAAACCCVLMLRGRDIWT